LRRRPAADYHAADMIDYAILVQAIEEWKAGRPAVAAPAPPRPQIPARQARPAEVEEEVVEYSGMYDAGEADTEAEADAEAPAEPVDSTVIYQLPDYENVEVADDEQ
jgi:hypothetical protein